MYYNQFKEGTPGYQVGDVVLTRHDASGWGSGSEICSKELEITDVRGFSVKGGYAYLFKDPEGRGRIFRTREVGIEHLVRRKKDTEINQYQIY